MILHSLVGNITHLTINKVLSLPNRTSSALFCNSSLTLGVSKTMKHLPLEIYQLLLMGRLGRNHWAYITLEDTTLWLFHQVQSLGMG